MLGFRCHRNCVGVNDVVDVVVVDVVVDDDVGDFVVHVVVEDDGVDVAIVMVVVYCYCCSCCYCCCGWPAGWLGESPIVLQSKARRKASGNRSRDYCAKDSHSTCCSMACRVTTQLFCDSMPIALFLVDVIVWHDVDQAVTISGSVHFKQTLMCGTETIQDYNFTPTNYFATPFEVL